MHGVRAVTALAAAVIAAWPAGAHDAWIVVDGFVAEEAEPAVLRFSLGHDGESEPWTATPHRIASFRSLGPDGLLDHQAAIDPDGPKEAVTITLPPGDHVVALDSYRALIELDAKRFNRYVAKEGITPISRHRADTGATKAPGTEAYARHMKALVRRGAPEATSTPVTRPVGQALEIVPLANPYALQAGDPFPLALYHHGRPVEGATLRLNEIGAAEAAAKAKTDAAGQAEFPRPASGAWYVHVVWAEAAPDIPGDADYATGFASLSFGFPEE